MKLKNVFVVKEGIGPPARNNPKVEEALAGDAFLRFSAKDWVDMALECIDQAGMSSSAQDKIEKLIRQNVPAGEDEQS